MEERVGNNASAARGEANEPHAVALTIVGITRFSLLTDATKHSFRLTRSRNYRSAKRALFMPHRMWRRFRLFSAFALPTIRELTKSPGCWHTVLISRELPFYWKSLLRSRLRGLDRVILVEIARDEEPFRKLQAIIAELSHGGRVFTFRLDDDDALASTYIDAVRSTAEANGVVLSFDDGFYVQLADKEKIAIELRSDPYNAFGLGCFSSGNKPLTIHHFGDHSTIEHRRATEHVPGGPHWVATVHGETDSKRPAIRGRQPLDHAAARKMLAERFSHLDLAAMANALRGERFPPPAVRRFFKRIRRLVKRRPE